MHIAYTKNNVYKIRDEVHLVVNTVVNVSTQAATCLPHRDRLYLMRVKVTPSIILHFIPDLMFTAVFVAGAQCQCSARKTCFHV